MIASPPPSHRDENIDLLRGVAALLVVWLHAAEVFVVLPGIAAHGTAWFDAADLLDTGRIGVTAFFAISGYVIVPTLRGPRDPATRDFLIKRFFRLYPPFWVSMACAAITVWWMFGRPLSVAVVAANTTMVPIEFGLPQMMGQYWTLEVELIFYALIVLLFRSGRLHRDGTIAAGLVVAAIAWPLLYRSALGRSIVDRNLVWSFLAYFLTIMFWGSMVRARMRTPYRRLDVPFVVVTALVFARPVLALVFGSPTVHREDWRGTLLGLLLFVAFTRLPARHAKPFVWLGTISYSLYLFHPAVFYPMYRLVSTHPALAQAWLPLYLLVVTLASVAVAAVVHRWVEEPSNAFARRIVARLRASGGTDASDDAQPARAMSLH